MGAGEQLALAPALLEAAARWHVHFTDAPDDAAARADWRRWLDENPAHRQAWSRMEALQQRLQGMPADLALPTLSVSDPGRRRTIKALAALLLIGPAVALSLRHPAVREWRAGTRTAIGERRTLTLADGSRLDLNTDTALDVAFDTHHRRLHLYRGEIRVQTQADRLQRPFSVETPAGVVRALGTRFIVRVLDDDAVRVEVLEHAVEVRPSRASTVPVRVEAGQSLRFGPDHADAVGRAPAHAEAWTRGVLVADDWPLAAFVAELGRHTALPIALDPALAGLRVSGTYRLHDVPGALVTLSSVLPIRAEVDAGPGRDSTLRIRPR